MRNMLHHLVPRPRRLRERSGLYEWSRLRVERIVEEHLPPEAYRLSVSSRGIRLTASGERGFFYADKTLGQLRILTGDSCPGVEIEDEPDLAVRGYMLDISRCKVPRMEHLFRLVDLLASFKYNQLQLYTEHTFAYKGHETVWRDASPMMPEEIRELEAFCANRCIELVPNQNALGHMERWLRHEDYHHLAESPYGFYHPVLGWRPHGTVLYPSSEAIDFIDNLLEQLLPCFLSSWVHLGCDEPWELGQGRSEDRAQAEGRHAVFLEYVRKLHALTTKRGKRMLIWSDELRESPERIREFPPDILPVAWGYEADHDFVTEAAAFAAAGFDFLIAPGDSSWNSFTGRFDTSWQNIRRAAHAAREHGALGMLLTSWGDHGHQQAWPTQLPGLVHFAQAAWNQGGIEDGSLARGLDDFVFRDANRELGLFAVELARIDTLIPPKINPLNSSFPYDALYAAKGRIRKAARPHGSECLFPALSRLDELDKHLHKAAPRCDDASWLLEEYRLAIDLTRTGLRRADAVIKGHDTADVFRAWEPLLKRFRRTWRCRNREGGLDESLELLRELTPPGHLGELPPEGPG